jgi:hypothetical protein
VEAAGLALLLLRRRKATESHHPEAALLEAVGGVVTELRYTARTLGRVSIAERFAVSEAVSPIDRMRDAMRAQQIARAHLDHVNAAVAEAQAADVADPWATALKETEWRAKTIADTEAASAASEERLDAAREASAALGIDIFKEWNAEGDACPDCASMDGETVHVDDSFSNGLEPGSAHPRCHCWPEILTKAA